MSWLILEALLALGLIIGIMVWTLKTRSDTPALPPPDTDQTVGPGGSTGPTGSTGSNNAAAADTSRPSASSTPPADKP